MKGGSNCNPGDVSHPFSHQATVWKSDLVLVWYLGGLKNHKPAWKVIADQGKNKIVFFSPVVRISWKVYVQNINKKSEKIILSKVIAAKYIYWGLLSPT